MNYRWTKDASFASVSSGAPRDDALPFLSARWDTGEAGLKSALGGHARTGVYPEGTQLWRACREPVPQHDMIQQGSGCVVPAPPGGRLAMVCSITARIARSYWYLVSPETLHSKL